uniref:Uncharacterized protein n=1 Tax=Solanum lycopersicum TaxID=4081 RepID=A0A3Q7I4J7_SOLLC
MVIMFTWSMHALSNSVDSKLDVRTDSFFCPVSETEIPHRFAPTNKKFDFLAKFRKEGFSADLADHRSFNLSSCDIGCVILIDVNKQHILSPYAILRGADKDIEARGIQAKMQGVLKFLKLSAPDASLVCNVC